MNLQPWPLSEIVSLIASREPFSFSRWGDGEWTALLGLDPGGENCDGHPYYPELGLELRRVLRRRPRYRLGMQPLSMRLKHLKRAVPRWLNRVGAGDLVWHNADVFHQALIKDEIWPLIQILKTREIILVGPAHIRPIGRWFPVKHFVEVPSKTAFLKLEDTVEAVKSLAQSDELISVSMGPPAKIAVDQLSRALPRCTSIDFGSVWDPFCGVKSRTYMRRL